MKFVKITIAALLITVLTCCASVFATYKAYTIDLKAFNGVTTMAPLIKQTTGMQTYKNNGVVNKCTSNYNTLAARVISDEGGTSSWIKISHNATSGWNDYDKTYIPRAYNLELKNDTWSPCTAYHTGLWYLDN